jgi:hypothetical protein
MTKRRGLPRGLGLSPARGKRLPHLDRASMAKDAPSSIQRLSY